MRQSPKRRAPPLRARGKVAGSLVNFTAADALSLRDVCNGDMPNDSELYLERARDYERKAAEAEDPILALTYQELARSYRTFGGPRRQSRGARRRLNREPLSCKGPRFEV